MKESIPLTWRKIPERYRLIGVTCKTCNTAYFPKRTICPQCRRKGKLEETQFSGKGKVFSFTEVTSPPDGFEDQVPYVLAIIELEEGAKVTGQIVDAKIKDVNIGSKVEKVFRVIQRNDPEGLIHYGFKFKLVG
ncbi:Zn-ribbon domain-containing OB-fold protein [Candidatus Micrarchaeota archaeon]|nr:Zn-ribbon domain-containing OB-fold protein [Candidatus Micrarchaeota archaeon]MBU1166411.1 Zn-ribbon domain-containing OB-fold protein [Candidatus Micrarchaeota archaeon]MBU1886906.1 Zn-ribbon domain-containing OB-fold protein [Candidatus Micrarchaeota archaeon]